MKLDKLIRLLEACLDAAEARNDNRKVDVVFLNADGEPLIINNFAYQWLDGRIEIDVVPDRPSWTSTTSTP